MQEVSQPPRQRRRKNKVRSKKKLQVLETVNDARIITSQSLAAIYSDIPYITLWKYLNQLEKAGYIDNVDAPALLDKKPGRNPNVFASASNHNKELTETDNQRGKFHRYMVSEVAGIFHAAQNKFNIPLHEWYYEPKGNQINGIKTCNPDAEARFGDQHFFIECDRKTEPVKRNGKGTDIWSKLDYYTALFRQGKKFRVLFLTLNVRRLNSLRDAAIAHDEQKLGLNIFWFGLFDLVDLADPALFFTEEYWFIPSSDEGQSLLKKIK